VAKFGGNWPSDRRHHSEKETSAVK